jgi:subtilisin family serine protease
VSKHLIVLAALVGLLVPATAVGFPNTEPDAAQQWYLSQDNAWSYWPAMPTLAPVKVAVIDSGIDAGHPEFSGRIAAGISFVGGSWRTDTCGHGTFVAGEIAANPGNGIGIAGMAFNASLLIAKVVDADCDVSTTGEIDAIRWAANEGARVINLSIGGLRDPTDPALDSYSAGEEAAIEYAWSKGALVVAAVGNGTQAPRTPWPYADYPAALPHVLGVGAIEEDGAVPAYSNRDLRYVDLVAPGGPIFSTIPRGLVNPSIPGCAGQPYSDCGPTEFQDGVGTSFAAPQVSAAAALLLGVDPSLAPSQVEWILERSATDANALTGCTQCPGGRDALTGWGDLNVEAALRLLGSARGLPSPDDYEPNDNAGSSAYRLAIPQTIRATLDYWDDPVDVYAITLAKGEKVFARLSDEPVPVSLTLWQPGTLHVTGPGPVDLADRAAEGVLAGGQERLAFRVPLGGTYYLEVEAGAGLRGVERYALSIALGPPAGGQQGGGPA